MIFRKIRFYWKDYLLQSLILFFLFLSLFSSALLAFRSVSSFYIYSGGYEDEAYYYSPEQSRNYSQVLSDISDSESNLTYDIESSIHGESLSVSAYTENNFQDGYGFVFSERIFFQLHDFTSASTLPITYCFVSKGYQEVGSVLSKNGKDYPILGTFRFTLSNNVENSLKYSGVSRINLVFFVDPDTDIRHQDGSYHASCVIRDASVNVSSFQDAMKGSSLNQTYRTGYDLILPFLYIGFLVPLIVLLFAVSFLLRNLSLFQQKENYLMRMFGRSYARCFFSLYGERELLLLPSFLLSFLPFLIVFELFYASSLLYFFAFSLFIFLYVSLFLCLYTKSDLGKVFRNGRIQEEND